MDGLSDILPHITNMPWVATLAVILSTILCTKGIDALLKWRRDCREERQYDDLQVQGAHNALEAELRKQIESLRSDFNEVLEELRQAKKEHFDCKIEQERLRGQVAVLQEKVARLEVHDKRGEDHIKGLRQAVKQIDPEVAAEELP